VKVYFVSSSREFTRAVSTRCGKCGGIVVRREASDAIALRNV